MENLKMYANLHTHSTHSDGVYDPAEIVEIAKKEGYKAFAVTDHDTATACEPVRRECEKQGLEWVNYAYIGRRLRKRDFRRLWITRINAAARINGMSYSKLMHGLNVAGINLNRKVLADLAVNDAAAFAQLVEKAKAAL